MTPFVAAAPVSLEQEEAIVLRTLNDCTPLPKDLQLMIVDYWRPIRRLIAYKTNHFNPGDDRKGDRRANCIGWSCIPYDRRVRLPPSLLLENKISIIRKCRRGLLIEHLNHSRDGPNWKLDYYPDICDTNCSTNCGTDSVSIASQDDYHFAVVGKDFDTLVAFTEHEQTLKVYDFDTKVWRDQALPDAVRALEPSIHGFLTCPGKLYMFSPGKIGYLYDGASWTPCYLHEGGRRYNCLFATDQVICFEVQSPTGEPLYRDYVSISTGKLIERKDPPHELVVSSNTDCLLIWKRDDMFIQDHRTGELTRVTTGAKFNGATEDVVLI